MCQSKAKGGKRCAAHHPGAVAMSTWASHLTGLDEPQVKSLMTGLRKEHKSAPDPTPEHALGLMDSMREGARTDPRLDEPTRRKVLAGLDQAIREAEAGQVPTGATMKAMEHSLIAARDASDRLNHLVLNLASAKKMAPEKALAMFRQWRRDPSRYQHCEAPDPAFRPDESGLPTDKATLAAVRKAGWETYLQQPLPVFVYGTLREGQGNRRRFGDSIVSSERASLAGCGIYGADRGFPYAKEHEDPDAVVVGDLVGVSEDREGEHARNALDMLEGFSNNWPDQSHYRRVARDVVVTDPKTGQARTVKAWTYLAGEWAGQDLREEDRIVDGDWVAAKNTYRRGLYGRREYAY